MKKQTQFTVGALVLMTLFTVSVAKGQSASQRFTATIPFEFNVGEQTLPAGEYEVAIVNPSSDQRVVRLRSINGTGSIMVHTHLVTGKTTNAAKLVFRGYGQRHFLAQAWTGADQNGLETSKSKAEKRYRNESPMFERRLDSISLNRAR